MKICILFYFLTSFICNAQVDSLFKDFNSNLIKDSISIYDNLRNFTLKLPKKWKGKLEGDNNSLCVYKTPYSSIFRLKGSSAYDVQGNRIETEKKDPKFVGIDYIETQEIVILKHPKGMYKKNYFINIHFTLKLKIIHGFGCFT
ncbi:hypothetical protein [Tenacibaculum halocynthiae]|uniref:hypothetical protein n=1 Tax=Tenacibaculum halocynthiae TaxID=1254437 RepID=UPI003894944A